MKKVELVNLKQPAGGLSKWLEVRAILKWSRDAAPSSSGAQSSSVFHTEAPKSKAQSFAASSLSAPHSPQNDNPWLRQGPLCPVGSNATSGELQVLRGVYNLGQGWVFVTTVGGLMCIHVPRGSTSTACLSWHLPPTLSQPPACCLAC